MIEFDLDSFVNRIVGRALQSELEERRVFFRGRARENSSRFRSDRSGLARVVVAAAVAAQRVASRPGGKPIARLPTMYAVVRTFPWGAGTGRDGTAKRGEGTEFGRGRGGLGGRAEKFVNRACEMLSNSVE